MVFTAILQENEKQILWFHSPELRYDYEARRSGGKQIHFDLLKPFFFLCVRVCVCAHKCKCTDGSAFCPHRNLVAVG